MFSTRNIRSFTVITKRVLATLRIPSFVSMLQISDLTGKQWGYNVGLNTTIVRVKHKCQGVPKVATLNTREYCNTREPCDYRETANSRAATKTNLKLTVSRVNEYAVTQNIL